ncbi:ornithine cyclodeaminase family protein [Actinomadura rupiterrae]|uniref:ornithine cyclodeaminase family protein n=1 Tax=Actinomadura rupiterrae TaxID=559627 RepID=UPI0020A43E68|nr:ornithine cyclodeaminase family protein [Actinomadura rupiterrae]MCP2339303.1 ornithine cyclodeaminase [Actinomadura rupiterrae]
MIVLNADDVRALYPMKESIEAMRAALGLFSARKVVQPQRLMLRTGADAYAVMPSYVPASADVPDAGFGIKIVAIKPGNPRLGLPLNAGLVLVFDDRTGRPEALMDGTVITAVRTAAVSAVATDLLARPDADTLAVLGAGVQARSHLEAMAAVRPLTRATVWSRDAAKARAFAASLDGLPFPVSAASSVAAATADAAIICTVTGSAEPVLAEAHVAPGTHINAVGSSFPDKRELTGGLVARCSIFVDGLDAALAEAGDLRVPIEQGLLAPRDIRGEVGDILLGRITGRAQADETTLFKSLGLAVEDALSGLRIARRARELHVGQEIPFP